MNAPPKNATCFRFDAKIDLMKTPASGDDCCGAHQKIGG
jgi:hypothetical protein